VIRCNCWTPITNQTPVNCLIETQILLLYIDISWYDPQNLVNKYLPNSLIDTLSFSWFSEQYVLEIRTFYRSVRCIGSAIVTGVGNSVCLWDTCILAKVLRFSGNYLSCLVEQGPGSVVKKDRENIRSIFPGGGVVI